MFDTEVRSPAQVGDAQVGDAQVGDAQEAALLRSFLDSRYAPEQVIGLQAALATFAEAGRPIDGAVDESLLVSLCLAAQRLSSWAMSAQVTAATELYRRRAVTANAAVLAGDWSEAAQNADLARRSTAAELGAVCGVTEFVMRGRLETGWRLATRPAAFHALEAVFAAGDVELVKVQTITDRLGEIRDDATVGSIVGAMLPRVAATTMPRLRAALDGAVMSHNATSADAAAKAAREERGVDFKPLSHSMGQVTAVLPIEDMMTVKAALRVLTDAAASPDDLRTTSQRAADVLVGVVTGAVAPGGSMVEVAPPTAFTGLPRRGRPGRRPKVEIVVTVPVSLLFGRSPAATAGALGDGETGSSSAGPAILHGYGPIPAGVVQELATRGAWRCAAVDDVHGTLLGLGRSTFTPRYAPGTALAEFVAARDVVCRFPGCGRRAASCEIDHAVPFPEGATCTCNTHSLCSHHHRLKHESPWRVERTRDPEHPPDTSIWTSPTGRRFVVPGQRLTPAVPAVLPGKASPGHASSGHASSAHASPGHLLTGNVLTGNAPASNGEVAARFAGPPPECDEGLPESVIPYLRQDGTVDFLDTRDPGPWAPNAVGDSEPPPF